jgi:hypothetical protein
MEPSRTEVKEAARDYRGGRVKIAVTAPASFERPHQGYRNRPSGNDTRVTTRA